MKIKLVYRIVYALFAVFVVLPVFYTFGTAIFIDQDLNLAKELFNVELFALLAKSSLMAVFVAILSTSIGTVLGFLLYKSNIKHKALFRILILIPLFISPYILAVAWKDFFFMVFGSVSFMSSYFGVIVILLSVYTPLSMLIIGSALANIDSQLEEAALMIMGYRRMFVKIILPLIKPALLTSFVLVFIFSISDFTVPAYFGIKVFTTEIFTQFSAFYNHSLAIFQSLLLIMICFLLLFSERKYIADAPFISIGGKGAKSNEYQLNNAYKLALSVLILWVFLIIVFPLIILFFQSFYDGIDKFVQAFYLLLPTFLNSFSLAFIGAIIIVFIGFIAAYISENRATKRIGNSFNLLLLFVFAIPSTIFGISLIKFYNQAFLEIIYSSSAIIIIAYVGKFSFISSKIIGNAIKQIPNSLDEAAQIGGVGSFNRLRKILIPKILPSIFSAFIIAFIFSLGELGTAIMLYPPGTEIMPIKVFTIMANAPQSLTSSMTLIVFFISLLVVSGFYLFARLIFSNFVVRNQNR